MGIVAHDPVDKAQGALLLQNMGSTAAATTSAYGTVKKAATQATFAGADVTALKVELNAWYAKLQTAGLVT